MSFKNPDVFKTVQESVGKEMEVNVIKNEAGYNEWQTIGLPAENAVGAPTPSAAPPATRVSGSNYETPAERAQRQVYIVKQSSIASAIALAEANKEKKNVEAIIADAQVLVDYVFGNVKQDNSIESLVSDDI